MSQQAQLFEYNFITLPAATTPDTNRRDVPPPNPNPKSLWEWLDDQNTVLSELIANQYKGWEIISHDVYGTGDAKRVSFLLRRPIES